MALKIKCDKCGAEFWVKGYSTLPSWDDPGEVVLSDSEDFSECCEHIQAEGDCYEIVDSEDDEPYDDGAGWEPWDEEDDDQK